MTYHGSTMNMEVDCMMNLRGILKVARTESKITGQFTSPPDHSVMCPDIVFELTLNADISKKDSVLLAMREFKESSQVWKPSAADTVVAATIIQRPIINYVVGKQVQRKRKRLSLMKSKLMLIQ